MSVKNEYLELTVDKFTFRVATDRFYSMEGVWTREGEGGVVIGLSDFLQQRSGDVAFAEIKPVGTLLKDGDEVAVIETIKVNISLSSPVNGKILDVNKNLENAPEIINQNPYGDGWLALIAPANWSADQAKLLSPQAYLEQMRQVVDAEARNR